MYTYHFVIRVDSGRSRTLREHAYDNMTAKSTTVEANPTLFATADVTVITATTATTTTTTTTSTTSGGGLAKKVRYLFLRCHWTAPDTHTHTDTHI